jgi:hypothetical protein
MLIEARRTLCDIGDHAKEEERGILIVDTNAQHVKVGGSSGYAHPQDIKGYTK